MVLTWGRCWEPSCGSPAARSVGSPARPACCSRCHTRCTPSLSGASPPRQAPASRTWCRHQSAKSWTQTTHENSQQKILVGFATGLFETVSVRLNWEYLTVNIVKKIRDFQLRDVVNYSKEQYWMDIFIHKITIQSTCIYGTVSIWAWAELISQVCPGLISKSVDPASQTGTIVFCWAF